MKEWVKDFLFSAGFEKQIMRIDAGRCPICDNPVGAFRDERSRKEFEISGLCQTCQDATFGKGETT
jgi:hypothetical protein